MDSVIIRLIFLFVFVGLPALGGCSALLDPGAPPAVYQLNPDLPPKAPGQKLKLQLAVVQPTANDMLGTNRVVTRDANGEIMVWKGVSWVSTSSAMMQNLLVQAYENVGLFTAMPYSTLGYTADYRLISDLREFTVILDETDRPAYVEVQLSVYLVGLDGGISLGYLNSVSRAKVDGTSFSNVLVAFNAATASCLKEICQWSVELLQATGKH